MPEPILSVLCEPFRRAATKGITRPKGLGLGLYVSSQIVQAHGGRIEAESSEHAGTLPRTTKGRTAGPSIDG